MRENESFDAGSAQQEKTNDGRGALPRRIIRRAFRIASSLRLAAMLLALIAIAATIGGIIPQAPATPNAEALYRSYGRFWHRIITTLSLDDVFHSSWFIALLGLFSFNLLLCMARRLRRSITLLLSSPQSLLESDLPSALPTVPWRTEESDEARRAAHRILRRHRYRVRKRGDQLVGERFRYSRLAPDMIHIGILVILVGGLLGIFRFEGRLWLNETELGKTFYPCQGSARNNCIENADFGLRIDDFGAEFYPGTGLPKGYWSLATIIEDGRPVKVAWIEVNRPLTYRGISFYQDRFGEDLQAARAVLLATDRETGEPLGELNLQVGESTPLPGTEVWVALSQFFSSFAMTDEGEAINRPAQTAENPAATLEVYGLDENGDKLDYHDIVFAHFPQTHFNLDKPYRFVLTDYVIPKRVVIRYSRNPGYPVVWWGFVAVMVGLAGVFYLRPKRVLVRFIGEKVHIVDGGASRMRVGTGELEKLADEIESELKKDAT